MGTAQQGGAECGQGPRAPGLNQVRAGVLQAPGLWRLTPLPGAPAVKQAAGLAALRTAALRPPRMGIRRRALRDEAKLMFRTRFGKVPEGFLNKIWIDFWIILGGEMYQKQTHGFDLPFSLTLDEFLMDFDTKIEARSDHTLT